MQSVRTHYPRVARNSIAVPQKKDIARHEFLDSDRCLLPTANDRGLLGEQQSKSLRRPFRPILLEEAEEGVDERDQEFD